MSEDGKTKTIQQLDSGLCAMRLQESILLSIAQIEQRGNLVGVKGTFALQDGLRSCRWKMKAVEQGSERKGILVETITSHKEWPSKGRNLRETLQASISTSSWTPLTSLKTCMQRGLTWFLWLCLVLREKERCCLFPLSQPSTSKGDGFHTELGFILKDPISPAFGEQNNAQAVKLDSNSLLLLQ